MGVKGRVGVEGIWRQVDDCSIAMEDLGAVISTWTKSSETCYAYDSACNGEKPSVLRGLCG